MRLDFTLSLLYIFRVLKIKNVYKLQFYKTNEVFLIIASSVVHNKKNKSFQEK